MPELGGWQWPLEVMWSSPLLRQGHLGPAARMVSRWLLRICKEEESTALLGNLCQGSAAFTVKKCFLISIIAPDHLESLSLWPFGRTGSLVQVLTQSATGYGFHTQRYFLWEAPDSSSSHTLPVEAYSHRHLLPHILVLPKIYSP